MLERLIILGILSALTWTSALWLRAWFAKAPIPRSFDLSDLGTTRTRPVIVEFTTPYCYECKVLLPDLKAAAKIYGADFAVIDAREQPDLAQKYGVRTTPTTLIVDTTGSVKGGWAHTPTEEQLERALRKAASKAA